MKSIAKKPKEETVSSTEFKRLSALLKIETDLKKREILEREIMVQKRLIFRHSYS